MFRFVKWFSGIGIALSLIGYFFILPQLGRYKLGIDVTELNGDPERGAYILRLAGCISCHSVEDNDAAYLAGGPAMKTPFGTFYGPNITPDPDFGIGNMSTQEFFDAVTAGLRPDGNHYFPAFPYTSYARMKPQDIVDLKVYLDTVPAVSRPSRSHDISWPFSNRSFIGGWKLFAYKAADTIPDIARDDQWERGRYIVEGPGHCGECHTGRNILGLPNGPTHGGSPEGPFSSGAPPIAGANSAIQNWAPEDTAFYLETGMKPDGDVSGGEMTLVIDNATSYLNSEDLDAIAQYLVTLQEPVAQ